MNEAAKGATAKVDPAIAYSRGAQYSQHSESASNVGAKVAFEKAQVAAIIGFENLSERREPGKNNLLLNLTLKSHVQPFFPFVNRFWIGWKTKEKYS